MEGGSIGVPCSSYKAISALRPLTSLSLDSETHLCNFGCESVSTGDIREIATHYLAEHSEDELNKWAISTTLLTYLIHKY